MITVGWLVVVAFAVMIFMIGLCVGTILERRERRKAPTAAGRCDHDERMTA